MATNAFNTWARSDNGWIAGVCKGLAERLDVSPGLVRILWLTSIFFLGFGLLAYFVVAISLPTQSRLDRALEPRILGVCARLAPRFELEVGLIRIVAVVTLLSSFGAVLVGYLVLHFVIPATSKKIPTHQRIDVR